MRSGQVKAEGHFKSPEISDFRERQHTRMTEIMCPFLCISTDGSNCTVSLNYKEMTVGPVSGHLSVIPCNFDHLGVQEWLSLTPEYLTAVSDEVRGLADH